MPPRLSLIAGRGALVAEVVAAALGRGYAVQLLTLGGRRRVGGVLSVPVSLADPEAGIRAIREFRATHIALAGGISLSDAMREMLVRRIAGRPQGATASLGDTALSGLIADLVRLTGAEMLGVHEIVPDLLAPEGRIGGPALSGAGREQAVHALAMARRLGSLDAGQALVLAGRRVVATEDIAGTDALIARVGRFRRLGLTADGSGALILAKAAKPDQPHTVDLPAIGPTTVRNARRAGVGVIVVQAGATLVIERRKTVAAADAAGISVVGLVAHDD
jgi:DUF1009 family protein